jgi:hypothetical protein
MALELEGYRWRNDDGSQTTATWQENQDVASTFALDTPKRLRVLINATADPANAKYRLEYKKSTNSQWIGVPVAGTAGHAITLATSTNITAGGEATTSQLTAPSGKNTSDFDTGRMWDDENGSDAVDITSDDYTELEWCIKAITGIAAATDVYQFRVTSQASGGLSIEDTGSNSGAAISTLQITDLTVTNANLLILCIAHNSGTYQDPTATPPTRNGQTFTLIGGATESSHPTGVWTNTDIFKLASPNAGTFNIDITMLAVCGGISAWVIGFTGANGSTFGTPATGAVADAAPALSPTSGSSDYTVCVTATEANVNLTARTGTLVGSDYNAISNDFSNGCQYYTGANPSVSWTMNGNTGWSAVAVAIKAA